MSKSAEVTYHRPLLVKHVVTAAEASANEALILINSGSLPTDFFIFVGQVTTSGGVDTPGFQWNYSTGSGVINIKEAGSATFEAGGLVTIVGTYFK
jgi:kynureninase